MKTQSIIKCLKISTVCGSGVLLIAYNIRCTYERINGIINTDVLNRERKHIPEYIYIDDPSYNHKMNLRKEDKSSPIGFLRVWKSLKHSLAWRLVWLCRYGNTEQRNIALDRLAAFKNNKAWDCYKLAQVMDVNTAVLLARTKGADLRYFLPPPIHIRRAAMTPELLSFTFQDMINVVQTIHPHSCIQHFLTKYFANVQDQDMEADSIPAKPDNISERSLCILCLDAIQHHLTLFHADKYEEDSSAKILIKMGLLSKLAELMLRNPNDTELDLAVLRIIKILSVHQNLLPEFYQNGLIRDLSRLVRSKDIRLSSSAASSLASLSGEYHYKPGLYLLHPIYRTTKPHKCDTLLVHGLRGGVFVTWRQRDKKCFKPIGLIEVTMTDDCDPFKETQENSKYFDPDLVEELRELEEDALLTDVEVVLHDIPILAKREPTVDSFLSNNKRIGLIKEKHDSDNYTYCWPKDWLPQDCNNLRVLGVNYWTSLTDWIERCPLQAADIEGRASDIAPSLKAAGVGKDNKPVVWLAHSMGGLIVKQVLIHSSNVESYKSICESTKALVFYSTPHKGSALATMPRAAAAVLWPSNDVRQLQENSPGLLNIHNSFLKLVDIFEWEIVTFVETMPTLVTAFKVPVHFVEANSADLGCGVYYELPLDHLAICKPATRQSILYTTVLDILQRVTNTDVDLKYSNPVVQLIGEKVWEPLHTRVKEYIANMDDTNRNDRKRWIEQIFMETFTD